MNPKDAMILAQTAAKCAAKIYTGTGDTTGYAVAVEQIHLDLLNRIGRGADALETATANVQAGFPQAQVQAPTPALAPAAAAAPSAPAISTGNDKEDAMWADLLAHPENWYNNIQDGSTSYTGGAKPDFRHKTIVDDSGNKAALWLVSRKFGRQAPDAVFQALGLTPPGAVQQVAPAFGAAPVSAAPTDAPF